MAQEITIETTTTNRKSNRISKNVTRASVEIHDGHPLLYLQKDGQQRQLISKISQLSKTPKIVLQRILKELFKQSYVVS